MTRRSETAALRVENITQSEPDGILVNICTSKGDPESRGRLVGIPYGDDKSTCPVLALRSYLTAAKIVSGPVFRGVDLIGRVSDCGLHPDSIGYIFKRTAARAGIENIDEVAGHSTRSGAISQSIASGSDPYVVRRQSGHKADSRSFERYVRVGEIFTRNAAASLGSEQLVNSANVLIRATSEKTTLSDVASFGLAPSLGRILLFLIIHSILPVHPTMTQDRVTFSMAVKARTSHPADLNPL